MECGETFSSRAEKLWLLVKMSSKEEFMSIHGFFEYKMCKKNKCTWSVLINKLGSLDLRTLTQIFDFFQIFKFCCFVKASRYEQSLEYGSFSYLCYCTFDLLLVSSTCPYWLKSGFKYHPHHRMDFKRAPMKGPWTGQTLTRMPPVLVNNEQLLVHKLFSQ